VISTPASVIGGAATPDGTGGTSATAAACAWCGAAIDPAAPHPAGRLACASCGSQTTWPQPTDAELDRAYGSWYRPRSGRFSGLGDQLLSRLRARLAGRLDEIAPAGRVLDVGSGDGSLLDALAARGRPATGLERESQRPDVIAGELADLEPPYAAVVLWHSLEHLRDAGAELGRAVDLLAPGAAIVVAMPNPASLQARAFGDRWLHLDLPLHLVHVPAPALLARLRARGARVERVSYLRGGQVVFGWLHGLVGLLPGHPDLYDAIRRPDARRRPMSSGRRLATLAVAAVALVPAAACALVEAGLRRGGTVYVEARRG
jgi:hypothetical protein